MVFGGLDLASQPLGNGFWRSGFGFPTLGKWFLEFCEAFPYVFLLIIFFITDIFFNLYLDNWQIILTLRPCRTLIKFFGLCQELLQSKLLASIS